MLYQPILLDTKGIDVLEKEIILSEIAKTYTGVDLTNKSIFEILSENKSIGVELLKSFSSWIWNKNDSLKILIIFQAEKLTIESQNSLLKIIEEPPRDTLIVLSSKNSDTLLQTIISRSITTSINYESKKILELPNFLEGNYLTRVKIIDSLSKEDNSREKALKLVEELINYYLGDSDNMYKSDKLLEIYIGIKSGTNLKLSLSLVNNIVST